MHNMILVEYIVISHCIVRDDGHHHGGGGDWATDGTSGGSKRVNIVFSRRKEAELRAQLDQAWLLP